MIVGVNVASGGSAGGAAAIMSVNARSETAVLRETRGRFVS